jgi:hypothetical protein
MTDFTADLECEGCGKAFSVELTRMRLHFTHRCPFCGVENGVTEGQAVKAHRRLDELEHRILTLRQRKRDTPSSGTELRF